MKRHILLGLMVLGSMAFAQSAPYRGYVAIERVLGERMLVKGPLEFKRYLYPMGGTDAEGLLSLLGTHAGASQSKFVNGQPNALNMLLWYLMLNGVSHDVGKACLINEYFEWNPRFLEPLMAICAWPDAAARTPEVMNAFWHALMSYDAPQAEREAWREFFLNSSYASRPAAEVIPAMVLAAFYNPNFLLRR